MSLFTGFVDFLMDKGILEHSEPQGGFASAPISSEEYMKRREKIQKHFDRRFDFNSLQGIEAIPIKKYCYLDRTTGNIDYILQRKATEHKENGNIELAIACLKKANAIMPHSYVCWSQDDYMRLVHYLLEEGRFEEAEIEEKKIEAIIPNIRVQVSQMQSTSWHDTLRFLDADRSDLVEMSSHHNPCGECAKYQGRIYSVYGKDKRFPKLPDIVLQNGGFHEGCRHMLAISYFDFGIPPMYIDKGVDPIAYSNRPFVDDRTPEQIKDREKYLRRVNNRVHKVQNKIEYLKLCHYCHHVAPGAFNAYVGMKNRKTDSWADILVAAKEEGIAINDYNYNEE